MRLTEQTLNRILRQGRSCYGAWGLKQLRCILPDCEFVGKGRFPDKGWKKRIIGSEVSKLQIDRFLSLKNAHVKAKTGSLFEQKHRATDNWADFDAIMSIDDQNHMNSIRQEVCVTT